MSRTATVALLVVASLTTTGATPNEVAGPLLFAGAAVALCLVLGLPLALLVHASRPGWITASSRALDSRATASVVAGAGLVVATLFLFAIVQRAPALVVLVASAATAWGLVGLAGCASRQGARMLGRSAEGAPLRCLVLGWLARAGLFAVPLVWPFIGTYVVVTAFGAPLVAMMGTARKLTVDS